MIIQRNAYLQRLIDKKDNGRIKIITGIRRVGKSKLLNEIYGPWLLKNGVDEAHIIRIDLESKSGRPLRNRDALEHYVDEHSSTDGKYYLFIDEAQRIGEDEKGKLHPEIMADCVNGFAQEDNFDVYVTGSNSHFLSKDMATEFADRGDEIKVWPLRFVEVLPVSGSDKEETLSRYMRLGGMPHVYELNSDEEKLDYLSTLHRSVYFKDIVQRYGIRKEGDLRRIVDFLYSNIGSRVTASAIEGAFRSGSSKITDDTIANYLDHCVDSFLFEEAKRFDVKGKKTLSGLSKYYAEDLGLRNAELSFNAFDEPHLMENLVYLELVARGYKVNVGSIPSLNASQDDLEVDFVCRKGAETIYVQSAYAIPNEKKALSEAKGFGLIQDSFRKVIIRNDHFLQRYTDNGYLQLSLLEFLSSNDSLERSYIL